MRNELRKILIDHDSGVSGTSEAMNKVIALFSKDGPRVRPNQDTYFMSMVRLVASRSTCARREVGCVLINDRNHIIATGYNGVPSGFDHCTDNPCPGAKHESGKGLEDCLAIHAEQNALLQCHDVFKIKTAYVTTFPCMTCLKLLMNTSCERIVYLEDYPGSNVRLWRETGRIAVKVEEV